MNFIWCLLVISGILTLTFINPNLAFSSLLDGSENAINLSIKLWAIYSLWLGLLHIIEETKLNEKIAKILTPLIKFLFGKTDEKTSAQISLNITSNLLGLGNASIPSGISAMENLSKGKNYLTTSMLMLLILNSCNLQIIPSTIISLRATHGSINSADIILPNLIASFLSLILGISFVFLYGKFSKFKDKNKLKPLTNKNNFKNNKTPI